MLTRVRWCHRRLHSATQMSERTSKLIFSQNFENQLSSASVSSISSFQHHLSAKAKGSCFVFQSLRFLFLFVCVDGSIFRSFDPSILRSFDPSILSSRGRSRLFICSFSFWWIDLSIFRSFILSIFSVSTPPRNPKSIDSQIFSFKKRRREPVPVCVPLPNFWRPCKRSRALSSSKRRKQTWLNWFIFGFRLCFFHSFLSSLLFIVVRALQRLPLDIWVKQTASAEAEKKKCASERPLSTPQLAFSNLRSDILPSHWKCDCPKRKSIGQYDQCCTGRSVDESEMMS